jgi:hypothetical protein
LSAISVTGKHPRPSCRRIDERDNAPGCQEPSAWRSGAVADWPAFPSWLEILAHYQAIATSLLNIHSEYLDNILLLMQLLETREAPRCGNTTP